MLTSAMLVSFAILSGHAPKQTFHDAAQARAKQYFAEARVAAMADAGKLWGQSLATPMLLVDDKTRQVYANQPDREGKLNDEGGVWVGDLPATLPVANFAFKWAGVRWTIIALSTVSDILTVRLELFMHEAFHWIQPDLGLFVASGPCPHLDTFEGRLWLRLEGKAAAKALLESTQELQVRDMADALLFELYVNHFSPTHMSGNASWN